MKKTILRGFALFLILAAAGPYAAAAPQAQDEKIFQDVKVLIFDEKWPAAESRLEELLSRFPQSPFAAQAVYYKGKCLEEMGGRERDALQAYQSYLLLRDRNRNLAEDAETSIIDLALKLYQSGDKAAIREIEDRLDHPNKVVQYYAAIQLSFVKDKRIAGKCVPLLKTIIAEEKNTELRDRARIALLRVDPGALAGLDEPPAPRRFRTLHIEIADETTKSSLFSLGIPWALADLALSAVPESDREAMRAKGYDIDKIMRDLQSSKRNILEIRSEGKYIKIWID